MPDRLGLLGGWTRPQCRFAAGRITCIGLWTGKANRSNSLLCSERTMEAAQAFLRNAVATPGVAWPSTINLDGYTASHRAVRLLCQEDPRWQSVVVRNCRYLNNIVEQDHRAIKQRCASMLAFKSSRTAAVTLSGIELAHRIRKRQFWIDMRGQGVSTRLFLEATLGSSSHGRASAARLRESLPSVNAPELSSAQKSGSAGSDRHPTALSTEGFLGRWPLPVSHAQWREVLALQVPLCGKGEDAFAGHLSRRALRERKSAAPLGAPIACGGCGSGPEKRTGTTLLGPRAGNRTDAGCRGCTDRSLTWHHWTSASLEFHGDRCAGDVDSTR